MPPNIYRVKERRATAADWTSVNPILAEAQFCYEIGTGKFKVGDGSSRWNDLPYRSETGAAGPVGPVGPMGVPGSMAPPIIIGSRATPEQVSGVVTSNPASGVDVVMFVAGSGGPAVVTSIQAADDIGAKVELRGRDATNTVSLATGGNLELNDSITMGLGSVLGLRWDGTKWGEGYRNGI